jgi:glycosyltransferase involved in cell wall biosynthesis
VDPINDRPRPDDGRKPLFTVFTSTRDRAHTLARPYESLVAQTFRDFEWLIVDNGSTDGTRELIARWQAEADFPIRYLYQENRGKHGSMNRGVREAQGELFLTLDSDDSCVPQALMRFKQHWDAIPEAERSRFSGVTCNCRNQLGVFKGTPFPFDPTDSSPLEVRLRYKVSGEKWGFQRTAVMREFPFPEPDGYTGLIPSGLIWNAIGRSYATRYVNDELHIWWQDQAGSLSRPPDRLADVPGALIESRAFIDEELHWFRYAPVQFYFKAAKYSRSSFHAGVSILDQARGLRHRAARALWAAALPLGLGVYAAERLGVIRYLPGPARRNIGR